MSRHEEKEKKPIYKKWWFILLVVIIGIPVLIFEIACIVVVPVILILELFIALLIWYLVKYTKKQKRIKEKLKIEEQKIFNEGYKKIYNNLYINDENKMLIINGIKYGFSQIIDCELVENNSTINSTLGNTKGKIKNNGKIKSKTNTIAISSDYCNELYMNITVDDINNPYIKLDVKGKGILNTTSNKYKNTMKKANEVLSIFKLIISKNDEKYVEKGTVTKIEHRYIQEKSYEQRLEELSKLYKDGALTDYEYSIKKQELLEKIK